MPNSFLALAANTPTQPVISLDAPTSNSVVVSLTTPSTISQGTVSYWLQQLISGVWTTIQNALTAASFPITVTSGISASNPYTFRLIPFNSATPPGGGKISASQMVTTPASGGGGGVGGGTTASPDGTTIPSATQIIDTALNVWTVSGGVVFENGAEAGTSFSVSLLLWFGGSIYQENSSAAWFQWNGTTWVSIASDPRGSPNGTTIPSATEIIDSNDAVWTVVSGVVYINGATAAFTASVILLLYYNAIVYQENSSAQWFSWNGTGWTSVSGDPRTSGGAGGATSVFGVKVLGSQFVNSQTNATLQLVGPTINGLESASANWAGIAGLTTAQWAALATQWSQLGQTITAVRFTLNTAALLQLVGIDPGTESGAPHAGLLYSQAGSQYAADPQALYLAALQQVAAAVTGANLVCIFAVSWDAPNSASGTPYMPLGPSAFLSADHGIAAWTLLGNTFKGNPGVIFDLFGSPFGANVSGQWVVGTSTPGSDCTILFSGGSYGGGAAATGFLCEDSTNNNALFALTGTSYQVAGMSQVIAAIRATNATNAILVPPIGNAEEIETWLATYTGAGSPDPLGQLACSWHVYSGYTKGPTYPLAVRTAGYPVLITETLGFDSALDGGANASGYTWAASNDIGYLWRGMNNSGALSASALYSQLVGQVPWLSSPAPTAPPAPTFGIKVSTSAGKGVFEDLSSNVLQLQGTSISGLETNFAPARWPAFANTSVATWKQIMAAWNYNVFRIYIDEWSWRTNPTQDGMTYQQIVQKTVQNMNAAGAYVICVLMWASPASVLGGKANGQPSMITTGSGAGDGVTFWGSFAGASFIKNNPAVILEIFNEPYYDNNYNDAVSTAGCTMLLSGGEMSALYMQNNTAGNAMQTFSGTFQIAGSQAMLTAIRNAGFKGVVLYPQPWFCGEIEKSSSVRPTDPLNNMGAAQHQYAYNQGAGNFTTLLEAGFPICITETYGLGNIGGWSFAQANKVGYCYGPGPNTWGEPTDLSAMIAHAPWLDKSYWATFMTFDADAWPPQGSGSG